MLLDVHYILLKYIKIWYRSDMWIDIIEAVSQCIHNYWSLASADISRGMRYISKVYIFIFSF